MAERKLRVLVVDDSETNRIALRAMVEHLGHHADVAADGSAAVEAASAQRYDLILMDLQMPVLDGFGASVAIPRDASGSPRIVALTATVREEERERCRAAGMSQTMRKPVSLEDLASLLREED